MPELAVGRELDAAVAKALGYDVLVREDKSIRSQFWYTIDKNGKKAGLLWYSLKDADAFAALDEARAKRPGLEWTLTYYAKHDAHDLELLPAQGRPIILDRMYNTRAEAISRAIVALAEEKP